MRRTLVTFHAHPDDEAIATGGVMARAADHGHRVVLVVATRGELGEVAPGVLSAGESLASRRVEETHEAAAILGVHRVEFLGYHDSGMMGEATNDDPACFWRAPVAEAAARLGEILTEERAEVLTVYDERGNYGHPDHIQVHRVGHVAARLAAVPRVYEATQNRDHVVRLLRAARAETPEITLDLPDVDDVDLGVDESALTTAVDVRPWIDRKRAAMAAHASQIGPDSFFLRLPPPAFADAFGQEWFIRRDAPPGIHEHDLFGDAAPT